MVGLDVDDIYTAVADGVRDKGGSVRETKKLVEAANDSKREGNKYFRKMTRPEACMTRPQMCPATKCRRSPRSALPEG